MASETLSINPNEKIILDAVLRFGALSRRDLVRITGFSRGKVNQLIEPMSDRGYLLFNTKTTSSGGRRPEAVRINEQLGAVIGIDLGATSLDIVLADLAGNILERSCEDSDVRLGPEPVLTHIVEKIYELLAACGMGAERLLAVGIGLPGPVEYTSGTLVSPPIMPGWGGYPIKKFFAAPFPNARVVVDNDVNVMAIGELHAGAGKRARNFLFVKIGTGIGCGIICEGQIYRGSQGCAGDIGHICVDPEGPVCWCGNTGCLEALAGGRAIGERATNLAQNGETTRLSRRLTLNPDGLKAEDVGIAAAEGDAIALALISDSGRMVGEVLAGLINFFNPESIFIGGGVTNFGDILLSAIRLSVLRRSLPLATRKLMIQYSTLGSDAGVMGAIYLAIENVFVLGE